MAFLPRRILAAASLSLWSLVLPGAVRACAVCFGLSDNPSVPRAYLFGAIILIASTFLMLGGLVYAAYRIEARRSEDAETEKTWA